MLVLEIEVPNEENAVETIGVPEDRSMDEEAAVGYRNPRKKRTKPLKDECSRRDDGGR
jgi:hypothetical protein